MAESGRVAVFEEVGKPMSIREFVVSDPEPGHVLLRLRLTNVCGSDLHVWRGDTPIGRGGGIAVVLGHEMTGRVHRLGAGVERDALGRELRQGDRVVFNYHSSCGHCLACLRGTQHECLHALLTVFKPASLPPHFVGGFGDYYYAGPRQSLLKVPDELSDEMVAGVNCALAQVIHGLGRANLRFGETVVIQGAGGLGLYATAVAREMGAHRIIVIDGIEERLALARRMGADELVDLRELPDARQRTQRVLDLTDGWGADLVVEVVGLADAMPEGVRMLGRGGRYLTMGNILPRHTYKEDPSILVGGNRSILGVSLYPPIVLKRALDFLVRCRDKYPLADVTQRYPLDKINEAFSDADLIAKRGQGVTRAAVELGG